MIGWIFVVGSSFADCAIVRACVCVTGFFASSDITVASVFGQSASVCRENKAPSITEFHLLAPKRSIHEKKDQPDSASRAMLP